MRVINRGRVYGRAYRLDNTSEDALATLGFALLALYGSALELLASAGLGSAAELAHAISSPKTARGFIGRLHAALDQVEAAVEACQRSKIGDLDEDILHLLTTTPSILPGSHPGTKPPGSGDEVSNSDDDEDDWDLTNFQWISPIPFDEVHSALRDKRALDTCAWLLQNQDFHTWETSDMSTFWLRGSRKYTLHGRVLPMQ